MLTLALALALVTQEAPPPAVSIRRADEAANSIGVGEVGYLSPQGSQSLGQILLIEAPGYRTQSMCITAPTRPSSSCRAS